MFVRSQTVWRTCIIGLLALSVLTACAALPAGPAFSPLSPLATPATQPDNRDFAVADLAASLSVNPAAITVQVVEPIEWPDASLGCPQPGLVYIQVITPGQRIVLEANGQTYEYHAGRGRVILCSPHP
jgi:hypothetical protein